MFLMVSGLSFAARLDQENQPLFAASIPLNIMTLVKLRSIILRLTTVGHPLQPLVQKLEWFFSNLIFFPT